MRFDTAFSNLLFSARSDIKIFDKNKEHIKKVVLTEEEKFEKTLDLGITLANEEIAKLKKDGKNKIESEVSFKLYDTYGFPYELTE